MRSCETTCHPEEVPRRREFKPAPYSLSDQIKLLRVLYHLGKKYSPFTLPWNIQIALPKYAVRRLLEVRIEQEILAIKNEKQVRRCEQHGITQYLQPLELSHQTNELSYPLQSNMMNSRTAPILNFRTCTLKVAPVLGFLSRKLKQNNTVNPNNPYQTEMQKKLESIYWLSKNLKDFLNEITTIFCKGTASATELDRIEENLRLAKRHEEISRISRKDIKQFLRVEFKMQRKRNM